MGYNSNFHNRRSYRLKGYDYTQPGLYFITICVKNMECMFGEIADSEMVLNNIGRIADECWLEIPNHFTNVVLCEYSIMPNHMHGILHLKQDGCVPNENFGISQLGTSNVMSLQDDPIKNPANNGMSLKDDINKDTAKNVISKKEKSIPLENTLFPPIHWVDISLKNQNKFSKPISGSLSVIIQQYKASVKRNCIKNNYDEFCWQSRFHDHIIRNEQSYKRIADYFINNPKNCKDDEFFK